MEAYKLIQEFKRHNINPYVEVPCSLLAPVIDGLMADKGCEVLNPVNEGVAMGIAAGRFLVTNKIPMVLTQNSGLCNTVNALTSLNIIYKIPVLYLISWRGQPGINDAPEHLFLGSRMENILKVFDIPYAILTEKNYKTQIKNVIKKIRSSKKPGALILKKGLIDVKNKIKVKCRKNTLSRYDAINAIVNVSRDRACYISTNGYISRETLHVLSMYGLERKAPAFYMLGSMGHALPMGLGIAGGLKDKTKSVIVLDGDGGCLMHMGAMAQAGDRGALYKKVIYIVLDNGVYASVGNQPTVSKGIDFKKIARACNYNFIQSAWNIQSLTRAIRSSLRRKGPVFLHVRIEEKGGQPRRRVSKKYTCEIIKNRFMGKIN